MSEKIAVLGPEGTFSHQAARMLFQSAGKAKKVNGKDSGQGQNDPRTITKCGTDDSIVFHKTIHDVFEAVDKDQCKKGIVPIENSLGGSVGFTLDALLEYNLNIEQEEIMPIIHCLMVQKDTKKSNIKYIYSHSQTYSQCEKYIRKNFPNVEIIDTPSNGESAKLVSSSCHSRKDGNPEHAAIGPELAAKIYSLEIIQKSIQDNKFNTTKFIVISKENATPSGYDRTSITVYPQVDRPGILWEILGYFKNNNVNLSKIESRPSKGRLGDYVFYMDFEGHISDKKSKEIINKLEKVAFVKVLGSYERKY